MSEPNDARRDELDLEKTTYRKLVSLAKADGQITEGERRLLKQYRQALGLPDAYEPNTAPGVQPVPHSEHESIHVLKMLARVAAADGRIRPREREWLEAIAGTLGVNRVHYAEIVVGVEHEVEHRRRMRIAAWAGGALALVLLVVAAIWWTPREREARERIAALKVQVDEMEAARARRDGERIRAAWANLSAASAFREFEPIRRAAAVLIVVQFELRNVRTGERLGAQQVTGSGFFISPHGLIATNRHVVEPWRRPSVAALLARDHELVPGSVWTFAWPEGARVLAPDNEHELDLADAYHTRDGSLTILPAVGDQGGDELDLGLLSARVEAPVRAIALSSPAALRPLDDVVVLGFPSGFFTFDTGLASCSASLGVVVKSGNGTVYIQSALVPGNSGGPVFDVHGDLVGIATSVVEGNEIGICIGASRLLDRLPPAGELLAAAEDWADRGEPGAARDLLRLAETRGPAELEPGRAERLRARLAE